MGERVNIKLQYTALQPQNNILVYKYLLKPTHAQLESHIKTHYSKNIKMFVSFFALHVSVTRLTIISKHPGVQWRGANSNVSRKQATGQGKVVQKHYIWRAGS